jgi:hypothetical protein
MANSFTTQILEEGPRNVVIKLVAVLDTSNQSLATAVDLSTLNQGGTGPTPTAVRIDMVDYSITDQLGVQFLWDATADVVALALVGREDMNFKSFGGVTNNAGAGKTGNILVQTTGYASGTQTYTIILQMVKQGPNL